MGRPQVFTTEEMIQLAESGIHKAEAARQLGVTHWAINDRIRKIGRDPFKPSGWGSSEVYKRAPNSKAPISIPKVEAPANRDATPFRRALQFLTGVRQ